MIAEEVRGKEVPALEDGGGDAPAADRVVVRGVMNGGIVILGGAGRGVVAAAGAGIVGLVLSLLFLLFRDGVFHLPGMSNVTLTNVIFYLFILQRDRDRGDRHYRGGSRERRFRGDGHGPPGYGGPPPDFRGENSFIGAILFFFCKSSHCPAVTQKNTTGRFDHGPPPPGFFPPPGSSGNYFDNFPPQPHRRPGGRATRRDDGPPGVSLLVRNVSPDVTPQDLQHAFGRIGEVRDVYIPRDFHSQKPKGFAFIEYATPEAAAEARDEMNKFLIKGMELEVVYAQEKRKTPNEMRGRVVHGDEKRDGGGRRGGGRDDDFQRLVLCCQFMQFVDVFVS